MGLDMEEERVGQGFWGETQAPRTSVLGVIQAAGGNLGLSVRTCWLAPFLLQAWV